VTTYTGTTESAANNTAGGAGTGERNRSSHTNPDVHWMAAREKYKDCQVTPTTSSFAIMSNGQVYMIDDAAGSLRQRMSTNAGKDWHTVTIMGNMNGDRISVSSIQ